MSKLFGITISVEVFVLLVFAGAAFLGISDTAIAGAPHAEAGAEPGVFAAAPPLFCLLACAVLLALLVDFIRGKE